MLILEYLYYLYSMAIQLRNIVGIETNRYADLYRQCNN